MTKQDSPTASDSVTDRSFDRLLEKWTRLDRGWQAVVLGLLVLAVVVIGVHIPW